MLAWLKATFKIGDPAKDHRRSNGWPRVERHHLKLFPWCAWCGTRSMLQVHHVIPFHVDRTLELEESNLLTLCMSDLKCHLKEGHDGNWHRWNPDIRAKAAKHLEWELKEQGLVMP